MNLRERAVVTTVGSAGNETLAAELPCLMVHMSVQGMATSQDRDELAARRKLYFDPTFNMPEYAQIQIIGEDELWNVVAGTFAKMAGPSHIPSYKRCELVRAQDG
jgi:hypothetical protein